MTLRALFHVAVSMTLIGYTGCVSVDTPDTNVKVGLTSVKLPGSESDPDEIAYAKPLKRVSAQQAKVAKQLAKRDWEDVVDESSDWITYTRELAGYAGTSHDPGLFAACCEQLVQRAQALREAALRHDAAAANQALAACDPPLNQLTQSFPLTHSAVRHAATASPPPAAVPPAQPSSPAGRKPLVP